MTKEPVAAFVATLPEREETLKKMLLSIRNQVDRIAIMLNGWPEDQAKQLLAWAASNGLEDKAVAFALDNSLKDGAKFYQTDRWGWYVVICDDDIEYPPDFVATMISKVEQYQRKAVVTVMGKNLLPLPITSYYHDIRDSFRTFETVAEDAICDIIGTCGTAYHHDTCPDLNHTFFTGVNSDIYMSIYCHDRGIRGMVVAHAEGWLKNLMPELPEGTATIFDTYSENDKEITDVVNRCL